MPSTACRHSLSASTLLDALSRHLPGCLVGRGRRTRCTRWCYVEQPHFISSIVLHLPLQWHAACYDIHPTIAVLMAGI